MSHKGFLPHAALIIMLLAYGVPDVGARGEELVSQSISHIKGCEAWRGVA